jgi:hypothetical protein
MPLPSQYPASFRSRPANPSLPGSLSGRPHRRVISSASPARSASSAPPAAAASSTLSASCCCPNTGSPEVHSQIHRAHDGDTTPAASAAATSGCAASRRAHPPAAAAACGVTRVCHRSHARADPAPSASYPRELPNAASTADRAATTRASATPSARSRSACSPVVSPAMSVPASPASPAVTAAIAAAGPDRSCCRPGPGIRASASHCDYRCCIRL